jgi:hypothetical protein
MGSLDSLLCEQEERWPGETPALTITALLMAAAVTYVWPRWLVDSQGPFYAQLSRAPFNAPVDHWFPHRILTPLISYLFGLRGDAIMVTNLIIAFAFIFLVYRYFRKNIGNRGYALLGAAILAFSLPTLNTFFNSAYCDSLTYVLLLLQWEYRKKRLWFYLLFFLSLLNRESVLFFVPWMAYVRLEDQGSSLRARFMDTILGFGITLGLYTLFRLWVASDHTVPFSTAYYITPLLHDPTYWIRESGHKWIGLFSVFKSLWIVPLVAGYFMWKERARRLVISMILLLLCTLLQYVIAYDSSRIMTQGFLIMIVSFEYLALTNRLQFQIWIGPVFLLNLFLPQTYTAGNKVVYMSPMVERFWPQLRALLGL